MEQARTDLMHRLKSAPAAARPGIPPTHPGSHSQSNIFKHEAVNHRRSHSDVPFAFLPPRAHSDESKSSDADDLFNAYMNLDSLDSGSKADSSENEAESSSVYETGPQGHKRTAPPMLPPPRHCRSMSMDSFVGKLNFADESPRGTHLPPPIPASFEFGNGEFNAVELKKIATNEKLAEIALSDPRRVKRILANRQSAARSKERKMRYISELEHKVQTLQTEATTLSAQLTLFQRDYSGLNSQNNELKFRLQAMEQQAKLRDALNDALNGEVQRLKLAAAELGETELSNNLNQQIQLNPPTFELQHLQRQQFQFQQQQQQNSSCNSETETKN